MHAGEYEDIKKMDEELSKVLLSYRASLLSCSR